MKRKTALDIAMDCIKESMRPLAVDAHIAAMDPNAPEGIKNKADKYARLAAALVVIEHMARQKELF